MAIRLILLNRQVDMLKPAGTKKDSSAAPVVVPVQACRQTTQEPKATNRSLSLCREAMRG